MELPVLEVSDAISFINQTLDYAYPTLIVEGEVASFKVNQAKFVFFDLKDKSGSLSCFMMVFNLRVALEDGMRVRVVASPKVTQWGKFSLTVRSVQPVGEGALKRSFEILKTKLEREGLFAPERKRTLPVMPERIAVISSVQAAGYADFIRIINDRWSGLNITVAQVLVQGSGAPAQIIAAIEHFNQLSELPEVIAIIRGGGSADDLSAFNDEPLTRAIASSRVPIMTGIGHEVDTLLADLAADVRAATPSNAAQLLVPDKREILVGLDREERRMLSSLSRAYQQIQKHVADIEVDLVTTIRDTYETTSQIFSRTQAVLTQLDPRRALNRGYAIARLGSTLVRSASQVKVGDALNIELKDAIISSGVTHVTNKKQVNQ